MKFLNKLFTPKTGDSCLKLSILLIQIFPAISAILVIYSSTIGLLKTRNFYFKDKNNYPFLIAGFLLFLSCLRNNANIFAIPMKDPINIGFDNWIGLFNWIPYFYVFWGIQYFLRNEKTRIESTYCFLIGSIPILISGIGQYFFNINGPYSIFNNLIIIFQRPLCSSIQKYELTNVDCVSGLTSFYSNPNYYGLYLLIILPLSLSTLIYWLNKKKIKTYFPLSLTLTILYSILLTNSRNALLGALLTIKIFIESNLKFSGFKKIISNLAFLLFLFLIVLFIVKSNNQFIPNSFKNKILSLTSENIASSPRIRIWSKSLQLIIEKPILGWGANAFRHFYNLNFNYLIQSHSHNIIFEIALNYGLPAALLIYINFLYISLKSLINNQIMIKNIDLQKFIIDLGWSLSSFIICITLLFDMPFYDYKLAISFWILLSGAKSMHATTRYKNYYQK